jgi:hypothetical protein
MMDRFPSAIGTVFKTTVEKSNVTFTVQYDGIAGFLNDVGQPTLSQKMEFHGKIWQVRFYLGGIRSRTDMYASCYLQCLSNTTTRAMLSITLINQLGGKHMTFPIDQPCVFRPVPIDRQLSLNELQPGMGTMYGTDKLISVADLKVAKKGFAVNNCVFIQIDLGIFSEVQYSICNAPNMFPSLKLQYQSKTVLDNDTLAAGIESLMSNELHSDVTIKVNRGGAQSIEVAESQSEVIGESAGHELFHAHRAILAIRSPVFRTMFDTNMVETMQQEIILDDCSIEVFKEFLFFLYTDTCHFEMFPTLAHDLLLLACKYQVETLKMICVHFMISQMTVSNAMSLLEIADYLSLPVLTTRASDFVINNLRGVLGESDGLEEPKHPRVLLTILRAMANLTTDVPINL